ncbi:MAG: lysophospholipase [Planctomycetaceae bacterium]|nr:lysophospholipase [Planctomycetaceae bacterium]
MTHSNQTTLISAAETTREQTLTTTDGISLQLWVHEAENAAGTVLLTHGLGEHSGRYEHVIAALREHGLSVVRWDLRGHGRSTGQRGHSPNIETLLDDISLTAEFVQENFGQNPISLWAHSLGGNLISHWTLKRSDQALQFRAAVLSAPWFLLKDRPSSVKEWMIRTLAGFYPSFVIPARFRSQSLTSDQKARREYEKDELVHRQVTARMVIDCFDAGHWSLEHAQEFPLPVFAFHGSDDPVTDPQGTQQFCGKAPNCHFELLPGFVHEPHNERGWESIVNEAASWLLHQMGKNGPFPSDSKTRTMVDSPDPELTPTHGWQEEQTE